MRVLYFASLRETLGCESESFSVREAGNFKTVASLRQFLLQRGGCWSVLGDKSTRVAVNQTLANDSVELQANDEVAFFPPVTGG